MIRLRQNRLLRSAALLAALCALAAVQPTQAQGVVQALPNAATATLNDALQRLARSPQNVPALVAAGMASLDLEDVEGAQGFFARAQAVAPDDGRVMTGLALVAVRQGDPITALQRFEQAEAAGVSTEPFAADRALAFDLVGRNDRAQRLYRESLSREENAEVIRRMALSYAIAGDAAASEAILLPLLQRQDRAAYRTRAFALAIQGRSSEAIAIAETMLPPRLSQRLAPYLRYMPRLTRAQQAAAANLGQFPPVEDMGRDTPEIAALAEGAVAPAPRAPSAADRLQPQGAPLGSNAGAALSAATPSPVEPPSPAPAQTSAPPPVVAQLELPPVQAAPAPEPTPAPAVAQLELPPEPAPAPPAPTPARVVAAESAAPAFASFDLGRGANGDASLNSFSLPPSGEVPAASAPPAELDPAVEEAMGLAEAFADFGLPDGEVRPAAGAVDITAIVPRREAPRPPAPPPPPAHPSRQWVQVATGQNVAAFRFDWRRIRRQADGLLDNAEPHVARWGQTNRLVVGPYRSAREAQELVSALNAAGLSTFRFTSSEGEEVQELN